MTGIQARGIPVIEEDQVEVVLNDADSVDTFGERTYPNATPWLTTTAEATAYAQRILSERKKPQRPIVLSHHVSSLTDPARLIDLLDVRYRVEYEGFRVSATPRAAAWKLHASGREELALTLTGIRQAEEPNTPSVSTVTSLTDFRLKVTWTAPFSGGSPITGYGLRYRVAGTTTWTTLNLGVVTSRILTGLDEWEEYEVQFRAENAEGPSVWSASAPGFTMEDSFVAAIYGLPSAPTSTRFFTMPVGTGGVVTERLVSNIEVRDIAFEAGTPYIRVLHAGSPDRVSRLEIGPWSISNVHDVALPAGNNHVGLTINEGRYFIGRYTVEFSRTIGGLFRIDRKTYTLGELFLNTGTVVDAGIISSRETYAENTHHTLAFWLSHLSTLTQFDGLMHVRFHQREFIGNNPASYIDRMIFFTFNIDAVVNGNVIRIGFDDFVEASNNTPAALTVPSTDNYYMLEHDSSGSRAITLSRYQTSFIVERTILSGTGQVPSSPNGLRMALTNIKLPSS